MADSGKVPHAMLFTGPEGSGSLPLALAFAQRLNCLEPQNGDSCGKCSSCRKAEKFIHPDLHFSFPFPGGKENPTSDKFLPEWRQFLTENPYRSYRMWMDFVADDKKQGNIPVSECQNIIQKLSLVAFEGQYKVLVLWMPELLREAGNVLLKLIEEPPAQTIFLLVAKDPDQLLTTILSRVQRVQIQGIERDALAAYLQAHNDCSPEEAISVANMSEGNLLEAFRLLEENAGQNEELFKEWMRLCFNLAANAAKLNGWIAQVAGLGREKQKNLFDYGLFIMREAFLHKFGCSNLNRLTASEQDFVNKFAPFMNDKNLPLLSRTFSDGITFIERNGNARIVFHALSFDVAAALAKKG